MHCKSGSPPFSVVYDLAGLVLEEDLLNNRTFVDDVRSWSRVRRAFEGVET